MDEADWDAVLDGWQSFRYFMRILSPSERQDQLRCFVGYCEMALAYFREFINTDELETTLGRAASRIASGEYFSPREPINSRMRRDIISDCHSVCNYCDAGGDTEYGPDGKSWCIDHYLAVKRGGKTERDNLVLSCWTCNSIKSTHLAEAVRYVYKTELQQPLHIVLSEDESATGKWLTWIRAAVKDRSDYLEYVAINQIFDTYYGA